MFTGIIEEVGTVVSVQSEGSNLSIGIKADLKDDLKIDQSISHNGVCLTVEDLSADHYTVVAIEETLAKTNLGKLNVGETINLERCMVAGDRLDGHIVQGHVDQTAKCVEKVEKNGSWEFSFEYDSSKGNITVEKGSISVNGVSLTVFDSRENCFSVAIIPYTYEHTNFKTLVAGDLVNLEFDIIGKYVQRVVGEG